MWVGEGNWREDERKRAFLQVLRGAYTSGGRPEYNLDRRPHVHNPEGQSKGKRDKNNIGGGSVTTDEETIQRAGPLVYPTERFGSFVHMHAYGWSVVPCMLQGAREIVMGE